MLTIRHVHRLSTSKADSELQKRTGDTVGNQKRLPDPEICRTKYLNPYIIFSDCLVENPSGCEHAVNLGSGVRCYHPGRRSFEATSPT
jgi:hypothetical protein